MVSKKNILAINSVQKRSITIQTNYVLPIIRMNEKTLKFANIEVNKKEFHKSTQSIDLNLVDMNKKGISNKIKHSDDCFKYFIGYKVDDVVRP